MKPFVAALTVATLLSLALLPTNAEALYRSTKYGNLDLSGRVRATNLVRHQDWNQYDFIMQRNELKLRFEWRWIDRGKALNRYKVPWLKRADLFLLYRGIYDSVYDYGPGFSERTDFQGEAMPASLVQLDSLDESTRDALKFKNRLREAYIDLYFKHLPLTMRIGKQQVIWGESDGFRLNDRANTLDLSWHFFQEFPPPGYGFDDIRQPFFMIKGLWDFRQLGRLSQPFLEFYWNPGDWNPGRISFAPRPWGIKLLNPLYNAGGTGAFQSSFCDGANGKYGSNVCEGLLNGTKLFRQGNYHRNPFENSQIGLRFHFITDNGMEWTINYLYQRFAPDGSPVAFIRGKPQGPSAPQAQWPVHYDADGTLVRETPTGYTWVSNKGLLSGNKPGMVDNETYCNKVRMAPGNIFSPWGQNALCAEYFAPYVHTIGFSLNYFEPNYTQTVWRFESVVDFDLPFYDGDKQTALFGRSPNGPVLVPGISKRNMWKGMIAFDRPTWIKSLNKKTTFFFTGQFFFHYLINHERRRCALGDITDPSDPDFQGYTANPLQEQCGDDDTMLLPGEQVGLVGPLDFPRLTAPGKGWGRDTIHQWEVLGTMAVLGFYRGGSMVPAVIYLVDPGNSFAQEVAFAFDWFVTPDFAVNFTTRLIWSGVPWDAYAGHKNDSDIDRGELFSPWTLDSINRGRSESGLMFTWQF
ncbi:MAG: DUF1302 family protein [Deltaproteobacteria bacterium]